MRRWASPDGDWRLAVAVPHDRLRPGVLAYRGYRLDMAAPRRRLELPDGVVTLLLNLGGSPLRVTSPDDRFAPREYGSMLAGLRTGPRLGGHRGRAHGVEVTLAPWMAYRLFGDGLTGMQELADIGADPADLLGRWADRLTERLAETPDWAERFAVLDAALLARLGAPGPEIAPQVLWAWRRLGYTGGRVPVAELARRVGWTERHLQNRFREQVGLAPKGVARVVRLQRALGLLEAGWRPAEVADACGFCDQAHFSRDFRRMTSRAPVAFQRERSAGPRDGVDRVAGQVTSVLL